MEDINFKHLATMQGYNLNKSNNINEANLTELERMDFRKHIYFQV